MLSSFRNSMTKGPAKIITAGIMFLLIGSFGLWGVEGWLHGTVSSDVATVGDTPISANTFGEAYRQRTAMYTQMTGEAVTPDVARSRQIDKQVLDSLVADLALDLQAKKLGLGLDQAAVLQAVTSDPSFQQGNPPAFDPTTFRQVLQQNGMNEEMFFARQHQVYLRGQLGQALTEGGPISQTLLQAIARYTQEKRNISYFVLPDSAVGDVGQPDAAALQAYYDEHKGDFRTKELRGLTYLLVTPAQISATATVTDADVQAKLDREPDKGAGLEQRTVQQIAFPSLDEAKAAAARIASGQTTFEGLVAERKLGPEDVNLGTLGKTQFNDQKIADAAFGLAEGATSQAVQGALTNVILKVTKILKPTDVERAELQRVRAQEALKNLRDTIDDERMGGSPLKDIASKLKLQVVTLPPVDAQGLDASGKQVDIPLASDVLASLFKTEQGSDPETVDGRDQGLMWFSLDNVVPSRDRPLDEAKADVVAAWAVDERANRLRQKADDLVKQMTAGKSFDDIAKSVNAQIVPAWDITRNSQNAPVPQTTVAAVFATPLKGFGSTLAANGTDRIVFHVEDNVIPDLDPKAAEAVTATKQLSAAIGQDLMSEYVRKVRDQIGVSINQTNVDRIVGTGSF
jgi:peptidyl-prolyl cis-trans isomerase D